MFASHFGILSIMGMCIYSHILNYNRSGFTTNLPLPAGELLKGDILERWIIVYFRDKLDWSSLTL